MAFNNDSIIARSSDRVHLTKEHLEFMERTKRMPYQACISFAAVQSAPNYSLPTIDLDKRRMIDIGTIVANEPDRVYENKYLLCRSILPPNRTSALQLLVDDPRGERCLRVSLCNFDRAIRPGTVLAIMHPWYKRTMDGSTAIRVENPKDHLRFFEDSDEFLNGIVWKASLPEESGIVEKKSSSSSTKKPDQSASMSTTKDDRSTDNVKKTEAMKHEITIANEEKGIYDLPAMIEESKRTKLLDMHADYFADEFYERRQIDDKGRGYVAVKTIPAGTLLMACQAYEMPESGQIDDILNRPILSTSDLRKHQKQISTFDELHELLTADTSGHAAGYGDAESAQIVRFMPRPFADVFGLGGDVFSDTYTAIWIRPSYFNHTCYRANCFRFRIGDYQFVRTKRTIEKDEELLVEYVSPRVPYDERQRFLQRQYGFRCKCYLCLIENSMSATIRRRIAEIATILDEMRQRHNASNDGAGLKQTDVNVLRKLLTEVIEFMPSEDDKNENYLMHRIQKALAIGIVNNDYPSINWKLSANDLILELFEKAIDSNDVYVAFLHAKLLIEMADGRKKMYEMEKQTKLVQDEKGNVEKWETKARKLAAILFGDETMADRIRVGGIRK